MSDRSPLLSYQINKWLRGRGRTVLPRLQEEQRANLHTCFSLIDTDGSGAIGTAELDDAFKVSTSLNLTFLPTLGIERRHVYLS